MMRKFVLLGIVVCVGISIALISFRKQIGMVSPDVSFLTSTQSPSPVPFAELTIPSLRDRKYESKLGELTEIANNSKYTTYLTSYDSDGLRINGLLTIPTDKGTDGVHPAIVFVHGYIAPSIYKTTEKYVDYVDYFARNGFVVFKIDLRGHGDSEGEAEGAYYSSAYVIDTLNAYSALQNAKFVDPKKIGLWGHSMAGNVTFRSFVVKKDIPALVIWAGAGYTYSDLIEYRLMDTSYRAPEQTTERAKRRQELRDTYGDFNPENSFWKQVVPTNYLSDVGGAILLQHAVDDTVVNIEYSRNLIRVLESTRIEHSLDEHTGGGHNIAGVHFTDAMEKAVLFFKSKLN